MWVPGVLRPGGRAVSCTVPPAPGGVLGAVAVRVRKTQIVSLTSVRLHVEADDAWEVVDDEGLISTTAWQRGNLRVDGTRARLTWESSAETRDFCLDEQWEAALEAVDSVPCLKLCCDSDVIIRASAAIKKRASAGRVEGTF